MVTNIVAINYLLSLQGFQLRVKVANVRCGVIIAVLVIIISYRLVARKDVHTRQAKQWMVRVTSMSQTPFSFHKTFNSRPKSSPREAIVIKFGDE